MTGGSPLTISHVMAILFANFVSPRRILVVALLMLSGGSFPSYAQELRLFLSRDTVAVGDRFYLSVVAEHDFAAEAIFPDAGTQGDLQFGDLEVLRQHTRTSSQRGGVRADSAVYEVTTFALDSAVVGPLRIVFTAGEDTFSVATESTVLPVRSLVPDDAEDVRDVAPLVEFPRPILPVVLASVAALLVLLAALYWWRRKRRPPSPSLPDPMIPPSVEAMRRLDALEGADLSDRSTIKPYFVELSDTLRSYLARRLGVNSMESTTRELIHDLRRDSRTPDRTVDRLREVLSLSDLVKFADAEPDVSQSRSSLQSAREIVSQIEEAMRPRVDPELTTQPAAQE